MSETQQPTQSEITQKPEAKRLPNAVDNIKFFPNLPLSEKDFLTNFYKSQVPFFQRSFYDKHISHEQESLQRRMEGIGLNEENLADIGRDVMQSVRFMLEQMGILLPHIDQEVKIIPMSDRLVNPYAASKNMRSFNPITIAYGEVHLNALNAAMGNIINGFQHSGAPMIGINIDVAMKMGKDLQGTINYLKPIIAHEYAHLLSYTTYKVDVEKKNKIQTLTETIGKRLGKGKPNSQLHYVPESRGGLAILRKNGTLGLGSGLNEAITTEIANRWARKYEPDTSEKAYQNEASVLALLMKKIAEERNISEEKAMDTIIRAAFSVEDFRGMVKGLSGPKSTSRTTTQEAIQQATTPYDHNQMMQEFGEGPTPDEDNAITLHEDRETQYSRPHFYEIVSGLMDYEVAINFLGEQPLTKAYIQNAFGEHPISSRQAKKILKKIRKLPLSQPSKQYLRETLAA